MDRRDSDRAYSGSERVVSDRGPVGRDLLDPLPSPPADGANFEIGLSALDKLLVWLR